MTIQSSGGTPPITWSFSAAPTGLPPGLSINSSGTISGTPATPGSSCFYSFATDSSTPPQVATQALCIGINSSDISHNALLKGHYAFLTSGFSRLSDLNIPVLIATPGSFVADGNGNFTSGVFGGLAATNLTGTYALGSDNRGTMSVNSSGGETVTMAFAVGSISSSGVATKGRIIQFGAGGLASAGEFELQDTTAFSNSAISGSYAFALSGYGTIQRQFGVDGVFTANGTGGITAGNTDENFDGNSTNLPLTGTYSISQSSTDGRGTGSLDISGATVNFVFYVVSANKLLIVSAQQGANSLVFIGQALKQSGGPFSNGSLSGTSIFSTMGMGAIHDVTAGLYNFNGAGTATVLEDESNAGAVTLASTSSASYSVESDGRVSVMTGGSTVSILYLVSSDEGFILNTDPNASTGFFEPQSAGPFTESSIDGNFSFGNLMIPLVSTVSSGVAALKAGTITLTSDINEHGTLIYGQISQDTYTVAANARVTTGSGNQVIYIISPTKFLMVGVNPANATPGITVAEQ